LQEAAPAYDVEKKLSVKAITLTNWNNVEGIAGIEFQGVTARLCLNLPGAAYD
jgi:hypothetical protein